MHSAKVAAQIRVQIRRFSGEVSVGLPKTVRVPRFRGRFIGAVYVALGLIPLLSVGSKTSPRRRSMAIEDVRVLATDRALFLSCEGDLWTGQQKGSRCGKSLIFHNGVPLNEGASVSLSRDLRVFYVSLHPGVSGGQRPPAPFNRVACEAGCDGGRAGVVLRQLEDGVAPTPPAARSGPVTRIPAPNGGAAGCRIPQ